VGVTFAGVQTTHKIAGASATGYATYLTSESDRGDYYIPAGEEDEAGTDGGVVDGPQGRWHGSPELLTRLGLSQNEPVQKDQLSALMNGVSPASGEELRRAGANGTRVAGIDLTFSAPKSVSALWAVSGPNEREQIEQAHTQAVTSAIERVEREVEMVRGRTGGEVRHEHARSVLAAQFVHTSSRLTRDQEKGGVPDPQLHSHVVVLGAERGDGRFAAVDSRALFRAARGNGAWYRAQLAHNLERQGLEVQGQTGMGGRYFEVKGVPEKLTEQWSARSAQIERAAAQFRDRYGRDPKAGELKDLTTSTRGTKGTGERETNVNEAWRAVGAEHGLTRDEAKGLFTGVDRGLTQSLKGEQGRDLGGELIGALTREHSTVSDRDLYARAYELAVGWGPPEQADKVVEQLVQSGELVPLQGGSWTTRELREREQQTLALAKERSTEPVAPVSERTLKEAQRETGREIGAPLTVEQREALQTITGPSGVSVLVGQAGTGKGVVLSAATSAWQWEGNEVIGTAVAGATAERLGEETGTDRAMTTDSLLAKAEHGSLSLNSETVVVMDEAGMADTERLAGLVELTERSDSKLLLVGDQAQLSPIGAGGMFGELQHEVPTAELKEVHRAEREWEREAWAQVREGNAQTALAAYEQHEQLHIAETREQAAKEMVEAWNKDREAHPGDRTVMLSDSSNAELDKINLMAQEHRDETNELGADRVPIPDGPYSLAGGDQIIFTKAMFVPGDKRVENGTRGQVVSTNSEENSLTVQTEGAQSREVDINTGEFKDIRLGYAQHVYKAQGLTVERSYVLIGGWQTDRERAYVALSRSKEQTDIYTSREDLGEQGMNQGAIERLGEAMSESNAQQASIATPEQQSQPTTATPDEHARHHAQESTERDWDHEAPSAWAEPAVTSEPEGEWGGVGDVSPHPVPDPAHQTPGSSDTSIPGEPTNQQEQPQERESEAAQLMRESQEQQDRDHDQDRDHGYGIE
jgi:conjugative relaxase-like TrwC/TraI family protein